MPSEIKYSSSPAYSAIRDVNVCDMPGRMNDIVFIYIPFFACAHFFAGKRVSDYYFGFSFFVVEHVIIAYAETADIIVHRIDSVSWANARNLFDNR